MGKQVKKRRRKEKEREDERTQSERRERTEDKKKREKKRRIVIVGWLLNVPATGQCTSGTDLLRPVVRAATLRTKLQIKLSQRAKVY